MQAHRKRRYKTTSKGFGPNQGLECFNYCVRVVIYSQILYTILEELLSAKYQVVLKAVPQEIEESKMSRKHGTTNLLRCDDIQHNVNSRCFAFILPSWKLTYPLKKALLSR